MPSGLTALEGIQCIVNEGNWTGTNKFGLLLALLDLAPLVDPEVRTITAREVAEKVLEVHWDQAKQFNGEVLRQVASPNRDNTTVVKSILELQSYATGAWLSFGQAKVLLPGSTWDEAVTRVQKDTWKNPVANLQNLPQISNCQFLYSYDKQSITLTTGGLHALISYGPALRVLIEARFVDVVQRMNKSVFGPGLDLAAHLFGAERDMPGSTTRRRLIALQSGQCLYTGARISTKSHSLDHVVPWSRMRISTMENFVVTTKQVNTAKRDALLGPRPLAKWIGHLESNQEQISSLAKESNWPSDPQHVISAMLSLVRSAHPGTSVWDGETLLALTPELQKECTSVLTA